MEIRIPVRLEAHLLSDNRWYACVTTLKSRIHKILTGHPEFFPDYTIHGIAHLNAVLDHAEHLITPETLDELKPGDTGMLVCAILIHDVGMFLRRDGVRRLIRNYRCLEGFEEKVWQASWFDYVDETRRLSQERMRYHFGSNILVDEECINKDTLDDDDLRVIGEFLRQKHPRLAHEIAIGKLPGSRDIDLFASCCLSLEERNMIGLLARSHGMAIRDTEAYLESEFEEGPMPLNTPVFYLMSVLRLADSLDAGEHRAPKLLTEQQKLRAPSSASEWTWNQRIDPDRCQWDMSRKNRLIYAVPSTSIEYVQLDKWLKSVQAELDLCWAILTEKYPNLHYRLSIHRITSRIYQKAVQQKMNDTFLTRDVHVTANPEIVKLMIEPLYGNDPAFGVRELLQNAVDACIEREHREHRRGNRSYEGRVSVEVSGDSFIITDNGVGMNEDVLLNYYLSAGSSYRSSDDWRREYTTDGKSQISRSGRFGVGFLAAFLLGDNVHVLTQHMDENKGYSFEFDQESRPLNVTRIPRNEPGTTLTITLKKTAREILQNIHRCNWFSWYVFDNPSVTYTMNGKQLKAPCLNLSRHPGKSPGWFEIKSQHFHTYLWKPGVKDGYAYFFCNGIRIFSSARGTFADKGLNVWRPDISVIDKSAALSINLSRTAIQAIPEEEALAKQVFRYHIARLLLTPWETRKDYLSNLGLGFTLRHSDRHSSVPFLLSKHGFSLNCIGTICAMKVKECVVLYYRSSTPEKSAVDALRVLTKQVPLSIVSSESGTSAQAFFRDYLSQMNQSIYASQWGLFSKYALGYTPSSYVDDIWLDNESTWIYHSLDIDLNRFGESTEVGLSPSRTKTVVNYTRGAKKLKSLINKRLYDPDVFELAMYSRIPLHSTLFATYSDPTRSENLFTRVFQETLIPDPSYPVQDMWIPFDTEERKKKFPKAFEELKVYMDYLRDHPVN